MDYIPYEQSPVMAVPGAWDKINRVMSQVHSPAFVGPIGAVGIPVRMEAFLTRLTPLVIRVAQLPSSATKTEAQNRLNQIQRDIQAYRGAPPAEMLDVIETELDGVESLLTSGGLAPSNTPPTPSQIAQVRQALLSPEPTTDWTLWIVLGVGVVIVAGGVFYFSKRR